MNAHRKLALVALWFGTLLAGHAIAGLQEGKQAFANKQYAAAFRELKSLADGGDIESSAIVGGLYLDGLGTDKNELRAAELLSRAAEANNAMACYLFGRMLLAGNGVKKDEAKALEFLKRSAERGYGPAQNWLGTAVYKGLHGYQKDLTKARDWYQAAADQGDASGQANLGYLYELGHGVDQNALEAYKLYRMSADQDNALGMFNLGRLYANGVGVARDFSEAQKWWLKAAGKKYPPSFAALGSLYEKGAGVTQDAISAHCWYSLAKAAGDKSQWMLDALDKLSGSLSKEQLAESQKRQQALRSLVDARVAREREGPPVGKASAPAPRSGSGTSFVVSSQGQLVTKLVTNFHVVEGCTKLTLEPGAYTATTANTDRGNDLAIVRTERRLPALKLRGGKPLRQGESVTVIGYPLPGLLAQGQNVSTGSVSALAGIGNNSTRMQISSPVQPGNSGGPVIDSAGLVVGVVQSKLDAVGVTAAIGDIPQNVNFAINLGTLSGFLQASGVEYETGTAHGKALTSADIAEAARASVYRVVCSGQ